MESWVVPMADPVAKAVMLAVKGSREVAVAHLAEGA